MALPDYYKILGVPEDASPTAIKSAYRQMAMKYHPDRGGSHEQMLKINEAFEVLFNPESRQQYDFARTHQFDTTAQEMAARTATSARAQAENYPRQWETFEDWVNGLAADFKGAKYGESGNYPTVEDSITGGLFLFIGGVAGAWAGYWFRTVMHAPVYPCILMIPAGAWMGRYLHEFFGWLLPSAPSTQIEPTPAATQAPTPEDRILLSCPQCSQKLRIPNLTTQIQITCASCKHVFLHPSSPASE